MEIYEELIVNNDMLLERINPIYQKIYKLSQFNIYHFHFMKLWDLHKISSDFINTYTGYNNNIKIKENYTLFDYTTNNLDNAYIEYENIDMVNISKNYLYLMNDDILYDNTKYIFNDFNHLKKDNNYVFKFQTLNSTLIYDIIYILANSFKYVLLVKNNDWLKDTFYVYCDNLKISQLKKNISIKKMFKENIDNEKISTNYIMPYVIFDEININTKNQINTFKINVYKKIIEYISLIYKSYKEKNFNNEFEKKLLNTKIIFKRK